mmetsp:Transcript_10268/g.22693  ORF Transcript_10268/g.22693 Transcript_10268/m.22693 type:complete len:753 (-) Transcript_10268:113-2371(-)
MVFLHHAAAVRHAASLWMLISAVIVAVTFATNAEPNTTGKLAAVEKALTLLQGLQEKVQAAGEQEATTYNSFACFCKDTLAAKTEAISTNSDEKDTLDSQIQTLASKRDTCDSDIAAAVAAIADREKDLKMAASERRKTLLQFETDSADLKGALAAIESAIQTLTASKSASFAQLAHGDVAALKKALALSETLGWVEENKLPLLSAALLQDTPSGVTIEEYSFQSDTIITMLQKLEEQFRSQRDKVDKAEVDSVAAYDVFVQEQQGLIALEESKLATAKQDKEAAISDIATFSKRLSTVSSMLLDDQDYVSELHDMCHAKATTYDSRSQTRANELQTLAEAISVVKGIVSEKTTDATVRLPQLGVSLRLAKAVARNPDAMAAIEASVESDPASLPRISLLATARRHRTLSVPHLHLPPAAREAAAALLRSKGSELKSSLLASLATQLTRDDDPFAKVKALIQDLIERLQKEALNEANMKGWCAKSVSSASQQRDYAAAEVKSLNGKLAVLESEKERLQADMTDLENTTAALTESLAESKTLRNEEKAENEQLIKDSQEGLAAVTEVIDVLAKFYATAANQKTLLLSQTSQRKAAQPKTGAPDAGFEAGEAYQGSDVSGVIGMLEVMQSDFKRTIAETEASEKAAAKDQLELETETEKSLAEKGVAQKEKGEQLATATADFGEASTKLGTESAKLTASVQELSVLHDACFDQGMSVEERATRRDEEVAALNRALCTLGAYDENGRTGVSTEAC